MVCPTCSRENLADALFCAGCRAPLSLACSNCGRDLARDASFCDRCGTPVSGDAASEAASADETAAPGHRTDQPSSFANSRYEVKEFLGEGGNKRVYRAHDSVLDRDVALAVIKVEGLDPTSRVRITREAQAMGRLGDHPHVLSIHDLGEDNGQPYMVLPLMPGGDVGTLLEKAENHRLPLEQAIDLAMQVCRGPEFAHSKSIVHRDLKPGNVWLTSDGTAKIGDFGLGMLVLLLAIEIVGSIIHTCFLRWMCALRALRVRLSLRADIGLFWPSTGRRCLRASLTAPRTRSRIAGIPLPSWQGAGPARWAPPERFPSGASHIGWFYRSQGAYPRFGARPDLPFQEATVRLGMMRRAGYILQTGDIRGRSAGLIRP